MLKIGNKTIGESSPTYFIAEIGSNFDGSMQRALDLINLAAENGADAVKFQHYTADSLVSDMGFVSLNEATGHQKNWSKSVFETYAQASLNSDWTVALAEECQKCDVHFFTSAYSYDLVDSVQNVVPAYKIGSGDITWIQLIEYICRKNRPVILATGASDHRDVKRAYDAMSSITDQIIILQCNTNYENVPKNFQYLNLNVLKAYANDFPKAVLGLSDHTKNYVSTLGAISLGARVIEKHFTDDDKRLGPDHSFALTPTEWKEMIDRARELELALGDGTKRIEKNELETVVVQRRSIRAKTNLKKGTIIKIDDVEMLRPCTASGLEPYKISDVLGKKLNDDVNRGEEIIISKLTN